ARNVCGLKEANSTEFDANTPHPVISLLEEQRQVRLKGGTMRLGAQHCVLEEGTLARGAYGVESISERHRHRYEFNNAYRDCFALEGMIFSGFSPDGQLVEIIELKGHPWFLAVQFHPEFKSKPTNPHPLFKEFIKAALQCKK
ncbi:MAG TPA: CTP synthetase, partial [Candidatus Brocadiales bacterium]|nr:CTP synthetase [Candidatus Brocadiales bacterium]